MTQESKSRLYFVAIIPNAEVQKDVRKSQKYIAAKFGCKQALKSPPHITIHKPFRWVEDQEDRLVQGFSGFFRGKEEFEVSLMDFGAFKPRVVFTAVETSPILTSMHHDLQHFGIKEIRSLKGIDSRPFSPHMTVAFRDLTRQLFQRIWEEFVDLEFRAAFDVDSAFLLKHTGKKWEIHQKFQFSE